MIFYDPYLPDGIEKSLGLDRVYTLQVSFDDVIHKERKVLTISFPGLVIQI